MSNIKTVLLGDICDVRDGTHDSPKPKSSGHPLVTSKHIKNYKIDFSGANLISSEDFEAVNRRSQVDKNDILISMIGTVGELALIDYEPTFAIKNIGLIKTGNELLGKYLFYYLQGSNAKRYIEASLAGSTQKFISLGQLRKFPIELPDECAQKKIADVLGTIDEKIELYRKMNETLEQMGQALFRHYFIDNHEAERWKEIPLSNQVEILSGGTPKTSEAAYWGGDIPWFSVVDAPNGADLFTINTAKYITGLGLKSSAAKLIPQYTTIISARGTVGKLALAGREMTINQSCYGLRSEFPFYTYLVIDYLLLKIKARAHGSVFDTITRDTFDQLKFYSPPKDKMSEFEDEVRSVFEQILGNVQQTQTLTTLRDTLLPRLIDGKIKV